MPYAQEKLNFDVRKYASGLISMLGTFKARTGRELALQMELGNYLVRQAGHYVCKIYATTQRPDGYYYYSDGSTHHLKGQPPGIREYSVLGTARHKHIGEVFGSTCQRGDVVLSKQLMPQLNVGDFIIIADVGAYCWVQSANFNMIGLPTEVIM